MLILTFRSLITVATLFFTFSNCFSQLLGNDILKDRKSIEIPFEYVSGFIILNVTYNNMLPLKFIFDTGAANTILFNKEYSDLFNSEYKDTITLIGADISAKLDAYIIRNGLFKLPNSSIPVKRDYVVLARNYLNFEHSIGMSIDGIIGADFFKRLTVKINYFKRKITLVNPNKLSSLDKWQKMPITIHGGKPYLKTLVSFDTTYKKLNLLLDTGANMSTLLHPDKSNIQIPSLSISALLGNGLSGPITGHIGLLNDLTIGKYKFENLLTNFQNLHTATSLEQPLFRDGLIGNLLLSKFHLVIDYANSQLYIKPNKNYKKEININRSGMIVHAFGEDLNQFVVHYIYPNSPASRINIKKGDILTNVGSCQNKHLTLRKINNKFSKKMGKKISLKILRGDSIQKLLLVLDDPIKKVSY